MEKKAILQELMDFLRKGNPLTVEEGKTLFREEGKHFRTTPAGKIEISREETVAEVRAFIERTKREKGKLSTLPRSLKPKARPCANVVGLRD